MGIRGIRIEITLYQNPLFPAAIAVPYRTNNNINLWTIWDINGKTRLVHENEHPLMFLDSLCLLFPITYKEKLAKSRHNY